MNTPELNPVLFIKRAIDQEIKAEVERLMDNAKKELERRTPEIIASIAIQVSKYVRVEERRDEIVFSINKS